MSALRSKWLAYAQLMRLPNLFTAIADPLAGWLIVGGRADDLPFLLATSACIYTSGMVFNDAIDYREDCRQRPERPLPQGLVPRGFAWGLATFLMLAGLACGFFAGPGAFATTGCIVTAMLFYNTLLKSTPLGPVALGACRSLNLMLGMAREPWPPVWPPLVLGTYVIALSFIAAREENRPPHRILVKQLLLGIIVLDALFVLSTGNWIGALIVLSLLLPAWALSRILAMT